jgi:transcription-repair coupling factor (superfamily II helicase)
VKQKERLKELKSNVHVLTLTATPIPRTLQMALTGVKEMSLITTPPVDRLAVRTFVMPVDTMVIREALLREHYRGGQSFYVCPRIKDMKELEDMLKELVPEIKVVTAHGQMTPTELEDRMTAFYDGQYDVLLATNIIESGIDIPTANTMIIHRADMFGLSQLYQIRGRIGRSKVRAYAYLTYPANQMMNELAQKRLEVMETLDTLGSGFQLASHDMDIRGAGNLLGDKQSGHIKEVGVELYQQMLEEAVAMAKSGIDMDDMVEESATWSPIINLGASVLIPETYVEDLGVRMSLYRRISEIVDSEDLDSFAAEMIDRFGDLPPEVENLLDIVSIKQLCKQAGVSSVEAGPKGAVFAFHNNAPPNLQGLMGWLQNQRGSAKLRPDQKISVMRVWENVPKRVQGVRNLMRDLAKL